MSLKRILVPFAGRSCEMPALRMALGLAKAHEAHVEVWHVSPDPVYEATQGTSFLGMYYTPPDRQIRDLRRCYAKKRAVAKAAFRKALAIMQVERRQQDIPAGRASASFNTAVGSAAHVIASRGRLCDLTIMCRHDRKPYVSPVVVSALLDTGRPLLLLPPARQGARMNGRAVVAWNGSQEAAHALTFAMPLIERNHVWVVTSGNGDANAEFLPPQDVVDYLRQHDVEADMAELPARGRGGAVGDMLLQSAWEFDAGLIVMGAFGHSRMREAILGGTTDYMLHHANVPVLLAH